MNNPKTTSRIWKDDRHVKGAEFCAEVKNVSAFNSYHRNPKQAFRSRKNNEVCKVYTEAEIKAFEKNLKKS